jgi:hypothetical protein
VDDGFAEGILIDGDSTTLVQDMCVDTICPGPLATCAGSAPCTIDLQSDVMHCGACENPCPKAGFSTHGTYLCSAGKCVISGSSSM